MAVNKPVGDNARKGAVKKRSANRAIPKIIGHVRGGAVGIVTTILARHRSRASFRRPHFVSLRSGLNSRTA